MVAEIVDASAGLDVIADDSLLPDAGASAYARHCRRVCALAVVLGRGVGLGIASLADLGVAAMFHDAGYATRIDGAPPTFAAHPVATLRVLLRQRGFHTAKLRRQLAAADHHRPLAGSPSLFGRILHICDDFDTLTRARADGALFSPAVALRRMGSGAGSAYDPVLFQALVNAVGRYPAGTFLRLDDGRVGVSISGGRDEARWALPVVRVLTEADGTAAVDAVEIDLAAYTMGIQEVEAPGSTRPE